MGLIIGGMGLATILFSIANFAAARSAMHETTASVLWCGGWLMIAAGVIVWRMGRGFTFTPEAPRERPEE